MIAAIKWKPGSVRPLTGERVANLRGDGGSPHFKKNGPINYSGGEIGIRQKLLKQYIVILILALSAFFNILAYILYIFVINRKSESKKNHKEGSTRVRFHASAASWRE